MRTTENTTNDMLNKFALQKKMRLRPRLIRPGEVEAVLEAASLSDHRHRRDLLASSSGHVDHTRLSYGLLAKMRAWREKCLEPTDGITTKQYLWLLKHTALCSIICCGVNFAISYISFHGEEDPTLWFFPTPISGSFAVTIGIELTLNWLINCPLMTLEVMKGQIAPIDPRSLPWWPTAPSHRWWLNGSDLVIMPENNPTLTFSQRLKLHCTRGLPWGLLSFLLTWPLAVAVCWFIWGNDGYNDYPLPEILIAIFGVLLVLVTLPFWGLMILADLGGRLTDAATDPLQSHQRKYEDNLFVVNPAHPLV
jgi:hypothetical protein